MISGLIAALAGILLFYRIRGVSASYGNGYELFILLVYGCVAGSRVFDNRIAPALYAFAPVLLYVTLTYTMGFLNVNSFIQSMVYCVLVLVFLLVAYLVRPELRKKLSDLKR